MESSGNDDAFLRLVQVVTSSCLPMALKAAVKLKVMDILLQHKDTSLSAAQIVAHFDPRSLAPTTSLQKTATSLDRILRLLASHGILSSSRLYTSSQGRPTLTYGLNSISRLLAQNNGNDDDNKSCGNGVINTNESQASLAPYLELLQDPILVQPLYNLHEAILDDIVPFTKVYGMPCFSYTQHNPSFDKLFNLGMVSHTKLFMTSLLQIYTGFESVTTLVDVGGGIGVCSSMITSQYPHIQSINFDLPHVVASAPQYTGVKHVGGDMFEAIPKAQAIFMKCMLRSWSDAHCLTILENCYKALPNKGKMIVIDPILPNEVVCSLDAHVVYQYDLLMLAYSEGGKERTKKDLEDLVTAARFNGLEIICNVHGCSVMEIYKE